MKCFSVWSICWFRGWRLLLSCVWIRRTRYFNCSTNCQFNNKLYSWFIIETRARWNKALHIPKFNNWDQCSLREHNYQSLSWFPSVWFLCFLLKTWSNIWLAPLSRTCDSQKLRSLHNVNFWLFNNEELHWNDWNQNIFSWNNKLCSCFINQSLQ